jgi:hypothetical protein
MDNARHVIKRTVNPRFLTSMATCDVVIVLATSSNAFNTLVSLLTWQLMTLRPLCTSPYREGPLRRGNRSPHRRGGRGEHGFTGELCAAHRAVVHLASSLQPGPDQTDDVFRDWG